VAKIYITRLFDAVCRLGFLFSMIKISNFLILPIGIVRQLGIGQLIDSIAIWFDKELDSLCTDNEIKMNIMIVNKNNYCTCEIDEINCIATRFSAWMEG